MKNRLLQVIIATHVLLLLFGWVSAKEFVPTRKKKLIVHTHVASPSPALIAQTAAPSKPAVKAPPRPAAKKPPPVKKSAPAKKTPPPSVVTAKKAPTPRMPSEKQKILSELSKNLEKIESSVEIKKSEITTPKMIDKLVIDAEKKSEDPTYGQQLIAHLQRALTLPEVGEVKIRLTLNPEGKLIETEVLQCASEVNKLYLEKELARQIFPPLEQKKNESFILTFCNNDS